MLEYFWKAIPDPNSYGSTAGCFGCAFRYQNETKCSAIPCQKHPGKVAVLQEVTNAED